MRINEGTSRQSVGVLTYRHHLLTAVVGRHAPLAISLSLIPSRFVPRGRQAVSDRQSQILWHSLEFMKRDM